MRKSIAISTLYDLVSEMLDFSNVTMNKTVFVDILKNKMKDFVDRVDTDKDMLYLKDFGFFKDLDVNLPRQNRYTNRKIQKLRNLAISAARKNIKQRK